MKRRWYVRCEETDLITGWFWTQRGANNWAERLRHQALVRWLSYPDHSGTMLHFIVGKKVEL